MLEGGQTSLMMNLDRAVGRGSLSRDDRDRALSSITWTTELQRLTDCDLIIEAVAESENMKMDLFRRLDALNYSREVVFATIPRRFPLFAWQWGLHDLNP